VTTAIRNAVTGEPIPPRRDPEIFYKAVLEACRQDVVWRSRSAEWCRRNGGDAMDYLWAVLKPARDAGNMPTFPNVASAAAFAFAQPAPPVEWKDQT